MSHERLEAVQQWINHWFIVRWTAWTSRNHTRWGQDRLIARGQEEKGLQSNRSGSGSGQHRKETAERWDGSAAPDEVGSTTGRRQLL